MSQEEELYTESGKLTNRGLSVWMDDEGGVFGLILHGTTGTVFEDEETARLWQELTTLYDETIDPLIRQLYDRIGW